MLKQYKDSSESIKLQNILALALRTHSCKAFYNGGIVYPTPVTKYVTNNLGDVGTPIPTDVHVPSSFVTDSKETFHKPICIEETQYSP